MSGAETVQKSAKKPKNNSKNAFFNPLKNNTIFLSNSTQILIMFLLSSILVEDD